MKIRTLMALVLAFVVVLNSFAVNVSLADSASSHGVISLTFDDGWQNQYSYAFPLMQARGIVGTFYVVTSHLDANVTGSTYLSFSELQTMQNSSNEIASHSVTHPDFTALSDSQIIQECVNSKQVLQAYGLTVNNFAYPWGDYNEHTDSIVSQYYRSGRDVWCQGNVSKLPYSQWDVAADDGAPGDPGCLSSLESIVDQVYSSNEWAVIYFHQILPNVPNEPEVINTQTFASFLDYINSKGVPTLTVNEALNLFSPPAPPPSVTISPTSLKIDLGQSNTFSSSVSGGNPAYSYQWYLNDAAISGATDNTWTFSPSSIGDYTVYLKATDALRYQVQSNVVTDITVYPQPTVSISPSSVYMTPGKSQTFNPTISGGDPPYNYQWFLNGTAISGATNASYAFTPTIAGTYKIYLNVTDYAGITVNSNSSTARVETPANVTITPTNLAIHVGQSQMFSSVVSGGTTLYAYQWFLNDSAVLGATGATWVFTPSSVGDLKVYLNVTDSLNLKAQSNIVTNITVYSQPSVTISPTSLKIDLGQSNTFSSSVSGGNPAYSYQWYLNNYAVSGAIRSNWSFTPSLTGNYTVYLNVTDSLGYQVQSNLVSDITVNSLPFVTINPASANMTVGSTKTLSGTVSDGTIPYTYQWYCANGTAISGATTSNLECKANSAGTYNIYLNATDNLNSSTRSNAATINVYSQPSATINPITVNITVGITQQFTSSVIGGLTPYTYQWCLNDSVVSDTPDSTWNFTAATAGHYKVFLNVTDSLGYQVQSNIVSDITVNSQLTVSVGPESVSLTVGSKPQFCSCTSGGFGPYSYQWFYVNGTAISGATTSGLDFMANQIGTFSVYLNVTDSLSSRVQSNIITINVAPSPSPTPTPIPSSTANPTPTTAPTSDPNSTPDAAPTASPTVTPSHTSASSSTPTQSVTPTNPPQTDQDIAPYYISGAIAAIVLVLIATDMLMIRKRYLSSSPPPPSAQPE